MNRSYTPNLIQVLRETIENVEQTAGIESDDPSLMELKTILDRRVADLERAMASEFSQAFSERPVDEVSQHSTSKDIGPGSLERWF